ncbi:hypothetical protein HNQ60_001075 [Povalibacter uvarum]|uniref:Lipoprotein n=1 Tax=Povalibacter uvarum TaxID=732238 RepID=A0A841HIK9_9GAMM|nr:hypothetical protein [Povalibacter uvarum]MBB6092229.1 hypothetical protein [Povalibacter uvarum]
MKPALAGKRACVVALVIALGGCISLQPVNYRPRYANYNLLAGQSLCAAAIGKTSVASPSLNEIGLRGATLVSPVENSFGAFVGSALEEELGHAGLYDSASTRRIDVALTENRIDPSTGTGMGRMAATFTVSSAGSDPVFSKSVDARREWPSSFFGVTAVDQARIQHGQLVADLLHKLFQDPAFIDALRCPARG